MQKNVLNDNIVLYNGDTLEVMDELIKNNIKFDSIITDPPYQTIAQDWDFIVPLQSYITYKKGKKTFFKYKNEYILKELENGKDYQDIIKYFDSNSKEGMWSKLKKLIKPKGAIVLFGSHPFTAELINSNKEMFRYEIIWNKVKPTNFQMMNFQPGRVHENIRVFSENPAVFCKGNNMFYYPILKKREKIRKASTKFYGTDNKSTLRGKTNMVGLDKEYDTKHPTSIIEFSNANSKNKIHPTQKPVKLMEYLVKTFTKEGEIVLDFTCGSGSTGVACKNLNRGFYGIDNGICKNKKVINGIELNGLSWSKISELRINSLI